MKVFHVIFYFYTIPMVENAHVCPPKVGNVYCLTYLLHGLFTMAEVIFWSIKNNIDKQNPNPMDPNMAAGRSLCTGEILNTTPAVYLKWSTKIHIK